MSNCLLVSDGKLEYLRKQRIGQVFAVLSFAVIQAWKHTCGDLNLLERGQYTISDGELSTHQRRPGQQSGLFSVMLQHVLEYYKTLGQAGLSLSSHPLSMSKEFKQPAFLSKSNRLSGKPLLICTFH